VIEVDRRPEGFLAMTLQAIRGEAARMDVFVAVDAILSQSKKSCLSGKARELRQRNPAGPFGAVTVGALQSGVPAVQVERDVRVIEFVRFLSPGAPIDQLEISAQMLGMTGLTGARSLRLHQMMMVPFAFGELGVDLLVTGKTAQIQPFLAMALDAAGQLGKSWDLLMRSGQRAGHGLAECEKTRDDEDGARANNQGSFRVEEHVQPL